MKKENLKKEIVKAILFLLLAVVIGGATIILTDNSAILIFSGILIDTLSRIFDKWIDEEDR